MAISLVDVIKRVFLSVSGRVHAGRGQRRLQLVETLNLGGKRQLILIMCDGKSYLVGAGGDSVHSIEQVAKTAGYCTTGQDCYRTEEANVSEIGVRHLH